MRKFIFLFSVMAVFFLMNGIIKAQNLYTIQTTNTNTFSPQSITIQVGDTVRWINTSQGLHNVVADDGSFTSGSPSTDLWTYIHVFTQTGSNPYYCSIHGGAGGIGMSGVVNVESPTIVEKLTQTPGKFYLKQNYPNPFNPSTTIEFAIPQTAFTKLTIYNSTGQSITDLVSQNLSKGVYSYKWNASDYASGIYFYRIDSGNYSAVKKLILIK